MAQFALKLSRFTLLIRAAVDMSRDHFGAQIPSEEENESWLTYVDIDEFIVIPNSNLPAYLQNEVPKHHKGVRFPQYLFGTEGNKKLEPGSLVTKTHLNPVSAIGWRAKSLSKLCHCRWAEPQNQYQKSAYRFSWAKSCGRWVHYCGERDYQVNSTYEVPDRARLHHYMLLDEASIRKQYWKEKRNIPEEKFRAALDKDISVETIAKVDLREDIDWMTKIKRLEELMKGH